MSNDNTLPRIVVRVSPWLGAYSVIESTHRLPDDSSLFGGHFGKIVTDLADRILTAHGRDRHTEPNAGIEITITLSPPAWTTVVDTRGGGA